MKEPEKQRALLPTDGQGNASALRAAHKEIRRLEREIEGLRMEVRDLEKALWAAINYRRGKAARRPARDTGH